MVILLYYGHSKEKENKMKVYSLLGFVDYEGSCLLGVFGSLEDLMKFLEVKRDSLGYDHVGYSLGYVESELGQEVDEYRDVVYL